MGIHWQQLGRRPIVSGGHDRVVDAVVSCVLGFHCIYRNYHPTRPCYNTRIAEAHSVVTLHAHARPHAL